MIVVFSGQLILYFYFVYVKTVLAVELLIFFSVKVILQTFICETFLKRLCILSEIQRLNTDGIREAP